jgi:hypothetical protein
VLVQSELKLVAIVEALRKPVPLPISALIDRPLVSFIESPTRETRSSPPREVNSTVTLGAEVAHA